jgi:hypothetical protein
MALVLCVKRFPFSAAAVFPGFCPFFLFAGASSKSLSSSSTNLKGDGFLRAGVSFSGDSGKRLREAVPRDRLARWDSEKAFVQQVVVVEKAHEEEE